jgi:hypothetical protein
MCANDSQSRVAFRTMLPEQINPPKGTSPHRPRNRIDGGNSIPIAFTASRFHDKLRLFEHGDIITEGVDEADVQGSAAAPPSSVTNSRRCS